jgi:hypothetical protein
MFELPTADEIWFRKITLNYARSCKSQDFIYIFIYDRLYPKKIDLKILPLSVFRPVRFGETIKDQYCGQVDFMCKAVHYVTPNRSNDTAIRYPMRFVVLEALGVARRQYCLTFRFWDYASDFAQRDKKLHHFF